MKRIKFAVVGYGNIGRRHAAIISQNLQAALVAIIDIQPSSALNIQQHNVAFFTSLESFLQSNLEADVINIATPNGLHAAQAIACLQANKNVVIEKPMALHTSDAEAIINAANKYKQHVFVVMQNRYSPPIAWLKELMHKNVLGKIFSVQLNCFWNRDERYYTPGSWHGSKQMDGGVLFTQFSHFIDIFYWLFGDIKNIKANMQSYNHTQLTAFEDSGIVTFEFGDNSIGCFNFSTAVWDKNFESSITIISENGTIKIGGQYMDAVEYCHIKNYTMPQLNISNAANDYGSFKGSAANHEYVIQNVIEVLNNKAAINTTASEGLKVVKMIERMYSAAGIE